MPRIKFADGNEIDVQEGDTPETIQKFIASEGADPSKYMQEINGFFSQPTPQGQGQGAIQASSSFPQPILDQINAAAASGDKKQIDKANALVNLTKGIQKSPLSTEAAKTLQLSVGGLNDINDLIAEIEGGNKLIAQALPFNIGDRKGGSILDNLSDRIGRLRSGGAINDEELKTFKGFVPGSLDFGKEDKIFKLKNLAKEFENVGRNVGGEEYFNEQGGQSLEAINSYLAKALKGPKNRGGDAQELDAIQAEIADINRQLGQ